MLGYVLIGVGTILVAPFWAGLANNAIAFYCGITGTLLILLGCIFQYRSTKPFERIVSQADWRRFGEKAFIVVLASEHGKGASAQGEIYARSDDGGYHACMAGVRHDGGTVEFSSSGVGFDCKIVIR